MYQEQCDITNPKERFLWALMYGLEYNGVPFQAPQPVMESWSEFLSQCGFFHVSELPPGADLTALNLSPQQIHYQPPLRGGDGFVHGTGKFVPVDEPIQSPLAETIASLSIEEKKVLLEELKKEGLV